MNPIVPISIGMGVATLVVTFYAMLRFALTEWRNRSQ
jgi:hypothetical protein